MTLQLDTQWSTLALTWRALSRLELVQKLQEKLCFYISVCKSFLRLILQFFSFAQFIKTLHSVRFMTRFVCNSSPISQKGGVAVLCPVAVLGTFPYVFGQIRPTSSSLAPISCRPIINYPCLPSPHQIPSLSRKTSAFSFQLPVHIGV